VRIQQLFVLGLVSLLLWVATRVVPEAGGGLSALAATGFLLLAGTLASEQLEWFRVPHLTAYIIAGIVAGPYVLNLIDHTTVEQLSTANPLALALIALAGGAELRLADLRKGARSLAWATLMQSLPVFAITTVLFAALSPLLPFLHGLSWTLVAGVSLMWGVISVTRSPSATLGVLSQTRAQGPIAQTTLATVMTSDVVVLIMLATVVTLTKPLVEPGATLSTRAFHALGREVLGSVSLGTTLGLLLTLYLRFVNRSFLLVLLLLGFGFTEVLHYLRFEPLLTFLVAGFIVQNLSLQGAKFLHAIEGLGSVVYVVFFASAGAHLEVPILRQLWPVALALCAGRALVTVGAHRVAARLADDAPMVRRWGWSGLVSQAGVALGIGAVIERSLPSIGGGIRSLVVATIAINEMVGPVLFKLALDKTGESRREGEDAPPPAGD
ncbi:MAG TPA: cation:proton antiporter, partial [Polyangia bacterium]|nr:cation:proton antiporter [Polyangia bacterium]